MRRLLSIRLFSIVTLLVATGLLTGVNGSTFARTAQDATPQDTASHPIVGTWIVDTATAADNDSPEIGTFNADGTMVGQGANRVAAGSWEVVDDTSVRLTLVSVFDSGGVGGYAVVRGTHVLDETGNRWTCDDCSFTVVSADGMVLDSGTAPAAASRLPVQGPEAVGTPLTEVPTWVPAPPMDATPAS